VSTHIVDDGGPRTSPEILGRVERRSVTSDQSTRQLQPKARTAWLIALGILLVIEIQIFHSFVAQDVVGFLPTGYDQAAYLTDTYQIYESMHTNGLVAGFAGALVRPAPQGILLGPLTALVYAVLGPVRLSALDLNIIFFIAYIVVTALVVTRTTGPRAATVAVALIISLNSVFVRPGGVGDFRYDHIDMCIWGILLTVTVFPIYDVGRRRPFYIAALIGSLLILIRLITAIYTIPLFLSISAIGWLGSRLSKASNGHEFKRVGPTLVPGVVFIITTGAVGLLNFTYLLNYYVRGHVTGSEKEIRAAEAGVTNLLSSFTYYPRSVLISHLGLGSVALLSIVLVGSVGFIVARREVRNTFREQWLRLVFVGEALLIPYVVLTSDVAKSPVVGNICVPPIILGVVLLAGVVETSVLTRPLRGGRRGLELTASAALICGMAVQLQNRLDAVAPPALQSSYREAGRLDLAAGDYVSRNLQGKAVWSSDAHNDLIWAPAAVAYYYETNGELLGLTSTVLGAGPVDQDLTQDQILTTAKLSDVLVLTGQGSPGRLSPYPGDTDIAAMSEQLHDYADANLIPLGDFDVYGRTLTLYVRPVVSIHGTSGQWITSSGVDVTLPQISWRDPSCATFEGTSNLSWLPSTPEVTSTYQSTVGTYALRSGFDSHSDGYRIWIDLPPSVFSTSGKVHVAFSSSFVPSAIGVSPDDRQLVILEPSTTRLTRGSCAD
jgi:hypothetical protein